jgi:hypothetical protein
VSEQVRSACARGCVKTIRNPDTREPEGEEYIPAEVGDLCRSDAARLRRWIEETPDLYAQLSVHAKPEEAEETGIPAHRGKISGSPALIRLDALALMDPHSTANALGEPSQLFGGDVVGVMLEFSNNLCDDLSLKDRPTDLTAACRALAGVWYENLCSRPWIVDLYDTMHHIHRQLRSATGTHDPAPAGKCHCGTRLYYTTDQNQVACTKCGHTMDGIALVRLAAAQRIQEAS